MSRTCFNFEYTGPYEVACVKVESLLKRKGFRAEMSDRGETVWRKGALVGANQFLKVEFTADRIFVSAWVKSGIAGKTGKEYYLDEASPTRAQAALLRTLDEMENLF